MKIIIIGVGNMGNAIMKGLSRAQNFTLSVTNPASSHIANLARKLGFRLVNTNSEVVNLTPNIAISTTPAPVTTVVAKELAVLNDHTIFISAAIGVIHGDLAEVLPNKKIVDIIPSTPVEVNVDTTGLALPTGTSAETTSKVMTVLDSLGGVIEVPERQLDIIDVISGCDSTFVDVMMDAMSGAAVKRDLDRQITYEVITGMVRGTGTLAYDSRLAPTSLRDRVTSPTGTTIKGVEALGKNGFHYAIMGAIDKADGES